MALIKNEPSSPDEADHHLNQNNNNNNNNNNHHHHHHHQQLTVMSSVSSNSSSSLSVSNGSSSSSTPSSTIQATAAAATTTTTTTTKTTTTIAQTGNQNQNQMSGSSRCASCRLPIRDRFIFNVIERNFHQDCVRCADCSAPLDDRCYTVEGRLYCRQDYLRRWGPRGKCAGCQGPIESTELVQRAGGCGGGQELTFHLACFVCHLCKRPLETGEQLHLLDERRLLCKRDFLQLGTPTRGHLSHLSHHQLQQHQLDQHLANQQPNANQENQEHLADNVGSLLSSLDELDESLALADDASSSGGVEGVPETHLSAAANNRGGHHFGHHHEMRRQAQFGAEFATRTGKQQVAEQLLQDKPPPQTGGAAAKPEDGDELVDANGKRRGPRTTIKPKQLETLKRAFESAPKPTRHTREQLANETGLNMRVIQVWFQNRRSKERRMKNSSGSARRSLFRTSSRRLRVVPSAGAGAAARATSGQVQQQQQQQQQQQSLIAGSNARPPKQPPKQTGSPASGGNPQTNSPTNAGFSYFSDSSNQGDAFGAINSQHGAQQSPYLSSEQASTPGGVTGTALLALGSPSAANQKQPQYQSANNNSHQKETAAPDQTNQHLNYSHQAAHLMLPGQPQQQQQHQTPGSGLLHHPQHSPHNHQHHQQHHQHQHHHQHHHHHPNHPNHPQHQHHHHHQHPMVHPAGGPPVQGPPMAIGAILGHHHPQGNQPPVVQW